MIRNIVVFFLYTLIFSSTAFSQSKLVLDRDALDYDRHELTDPKFSLKIKSSDNRSGLGGIDGWAVTGWFEYDFKVKHRGWYALTAIIKGKYKNVEYIIDPESYKKGTGGLYLFGTGQGLNGLIDKVSNIWLEAGSHTLRAQQYYWTGFPPIVKFVIKPSSSDIANTVRVTFPDASSVFRKGKCEPLEIYSGQLLTPKKLTVFVRDSTTQKELHRYSVILPASENLTKQQIPVYCMSAGDYTLSFGDSQSHLIAKQDIGYIKYQVIDTIKNDKVGDSIKKILVDEINAVETKPDYTGGGETHVVQSPFGSYRESGDTEWRKYQHKHAALRAVSPKPSWFAYKLNIDKLQQPYIVEIDYPDDRKRSFAIALRESTPVKYPVAGGVDSGGEFSLSNTMLTQSLIFWPRAKNPRIVFMNAREGNRAAAARVRVYRVEGGFPSLHISMDGGRQFANWYEEGSNFTSLYGETSSPDDIKTAIERWVELARYMGINTLYPTVSVYGFNLYPSNYNRAFSSRPDTDILREMLLIAEQNNMKLIPDLHPRSDELSWGVSGAKPSKANLLVSKNGETLKNIPPHYNPVYPSNQEWYVGMVGELADRYKDSPALLGVSLRVMQWQNPTLNNFQSLDWGYGDYTVGLFQKETGVTLPVKISGSNRFHKRYEWLMSNVRNKWLDWRSEKIAQLYQKMVNRIRQARPDFNLYVLIFDGYPSKHGIDWLTEAGMDMRKLLKVNGLILINSLHAYGRLYDNLTTQGARDNLLDPEVLDAMVKPYQNGNILSYTRYFEATKNIVLPEELGFGSATKKTWVSAVINPSGRHYLERFAVALAETDAKFLGDGGNGFTIGQPLLREFLQDYRALPAVPFSPRKDARDPVAVWELIDNIEGNYFYAVNRERFPVELKLTTSGTGSFTRVTTGAQLPSSDGVLTLQLKPYQLMSFKGSDDIHIVSVVTNIPDTEFQRVKKQVVWLEALLKKMPQRKNTEHQKKIQLLVAEARLALDKGFIWRARTIIENHHLLKLYKSIDKYPPELRNAIVH